MSQYPLVNRKRFVSSPANELVEPFDALSKETRIPKSRLLDMDIEDLLKKYEKRTAEPSFFYPRRESKGRGRGPGETVGFPD